MVDTPDYRVGLSAIVTLNPGPNGVMLRSGNRMKALGTILLRPTIARIQLVNPDLWIIEEPDRLVRQWFLFHLRQFIKMWDNQPVDVSVPVR